MAQLSDLEYLRLSKGGKFAYKLGRFFTGIPRAVGNVFLKLWELLKKDICRSLAPLQFWGGQE